MALTKIEEIASRCLQGFCANPDTQYSSEKLAEMSVDYAKELIANLPKEETRRRVEIKSTALCKELEIDKLEGWFIQFAQYSNQDNESRLFVYCELDNGRVIKLDTTDIKFINGGVK
jgi:hypothetical protein